MEIDASSVSPDIGSGSGIVLVEHLRKLLFTILTASNAAKPEILRNSKPKPTLNFALFVYSGFRHHATTVCGIEGFQETAPGHSNLLFKVFLVDAGSRADSN
jgi:hypothetical protein